LEPIPKPDYADESPMFKDRGDCVSFVATGGKNPPAGRQAGPSSGRAIDRCRARSAARHR